MLRAGYPGQSGQIWSGTGSRGRLLRDDSCRNLPSLDRFSRGPLTGCKPRGPASPSVETREGLARPTRRNWIATCPPPHRKRCQGTPRDHPDLAASAKGCFAGLNLSGPMWAMKPARVRSWPSRARPAAGGAGDLPALLSRLNQVLAWHRRSILGELTVGERVCRDAGAACAHELGQACIVMTADRSPVQGAGDRIRLAVSGGRPVPGWRGSRQGRHVEAKHRRHGLRGLAGSLAWLGPAIGPAAFREWVAQRAAPPSAAERSRRWRLHLVPSLSEGKWLADIITGPVLPGASLGAGVTAIYGGEYCTFSERQRALLPSIAATWAVTGPRGLPVWLEIAEEALASAASASSLPGDAPLAASVLLPSRLRASQAATGGRFPRSLLLEEKINSHPLELPFKTTSSFVRKRCCYSRACGVWS